MWNLQMCEVCKLSALNTTYNENILMQPLSYDCAKYHDWIYIWTIIYIICVLIVTVLSLCFDLQIICLSLGFYLRWLLNWFQEILWKCTKGIFSKLWQWIVKRLTENISVNKICNIENQVLLLNISFYISYRLLVFSCTVNPVKSNNPGEIAKVVAPCRRSSQIPLLRS